MTETPARGRPEAGSARGRDLSRQNVATALVLLVAAVAIAALIAFAEQPRPPDLAALREDLRAHLDPAFPGRGVTDYPGNTVDDVPKAYAMILKAELEAGRRKGEPVSALALSAGNFLLEHADERHDGFPGWGVPIAWDPYGDGSVNPAHTKYTISTGIVIDALLDWVEADAKAPRERILALSSDAARPYLQEGALSPSGMLPYSLEAVDRPYDTFNPAAYMAGAMQRLSRFVGDGGLRDKLQAVADKTVEVHLAQRRLAPDGSWYWTYSINENVPNDLAHAGYVIEGLRLYAQNGGRLGSRLDLPAIERHLDDFLLQPGDRLIAWPTLRRDANTPGRAYDLGLGMHLACLTGRRNLAERFARSLPLYRTDDGHYLKYPRGYDGKPLVVREYEAYILLGLASCSGMKAAP